MSMLVYKKTNTKQKKYNFFIGVTDDVKLQGYEF